MKKLVALTLVGAFMAPVLYAAVKPVTLQNRKAQEVAMTVEDLAHELTAEDREALYHNIKAKFKGSLGGARYAHDPKLASQIYQKVMTQYENMQLKHQEVRPFKLQILEILNPDDTTPATKLRKKAKMGPGPVMTSPARRLRRKAEMGPGPVMTGPATGLRKPVKMGPGPVKNGAMRTHPVGPETGLEPVRPLHPRTTEGTRFPSKLRGPQSGSTRANLGH